MEDNITDIDYDSVQALEEFNGSHNNSGVGPVSYTHLTLPTKA